MDRIDVISPDPKRSQPNLLALMSSESLDPFPLFSLTRDDELMTSMTSYQQTVDLRSVHSVSWDRNDRAIITGKAGKEGKGLLILIAFQI